MSRSHSLDTNGMTTRCARACAMERSGFVAPLALAALLAASPAAAQTPPESTALSVSVRQTRTMCFQDRVEVTGVLVARQEVDVGADREGLKVAQVLVQPLEEVSPGQVLARLSAIEGPAAEAAVRSPVAGFVVRSNARLGMPASPRQGPLFQIVVRGEIDLQAEAPIPDLAKLAVGQAVSVRPLGAPEMPARIRAVEAGTDPATQLGRVRIGIGPAPDLRVGTFARGVVAVGERCGIGVPYSAVMYEPDGTIVQVVNGDRIESRQVSVGLLSGENAEIRSGLAESDLVVVRAGPFLREGDQVKPIVVRETAR
ncbi:efflux RND transporter periplasmic adaptor subunit [Methylobacterium iners]|uniref:RND transporter n=2 Tax=Methylobacterium iners TaxID=418707 RepID=A0ABQ4S178_9HYPH|nr:hypothetical protein OCOJLMKI_2883 [Methylobacterium iners]